MKHCYFLLVFLISFTPVFGQQEAFEKVIKSQLDIKEEDYHRFVLQALPDNKNLSVAAIAKYNGEVTEDSFDCDLILLLIDNPSQKIIGRYTAEKKFSSDAYQFSQLSLDMANYKVSENTRAFGVRTGFEGSSRIYPSWDNALSLFIIEKNKFKLILDQFPMDELHGDWDTNCTYDGEEIKSVAIMQSKKTNGYFDILIKSVKTIEKSRPSEKEGEPCIDTETKEKPKTQLLQFVSGMYKAKKNTK